MKTIKFLASVLIATVCAFGIAACGDGDEKSPATGSSDNDSGITSNLTINDTEFAATNAYWAAESTEGTTTYLISLLNYNLQGQEPDPCYAIEIFYNVESGATEELATGEFTDYTVMASVVGSSVSSSYEAVSLGVTNPPVLRVTKNGNDYSVVVGDLTYHPVDLEFPQAYSGTAFTYTGSIQISPDNGVLRKVR